MDILGESMFFARKRKRAAEIQPIKDDASATTFYRRGKWLKSDCDR